MARRRLREHSEANAPRTSSWPMHAGILAAATAASADYVRSIKRKMREAHDEAHHKIEEALRANKGLPVTVDVTPILTEYRG